MTSSLGSMLFDYSDGDTPVDPKGSELLEGFQSLWHTIDALQSYSTFQAENCETALAQSLEWCKGVSADRSASLAAFPTEISKIAQEIANITINIDLVCDKIARLERALDIAADLRDFRERCEWSAEQQVKVASLERAHARRLAECQEEQEELLASETKEKLPLVMAVSNALDRVFSPSAPRSRAVSVASPSAPFASSSTPSDQHSIMSSPPAASSFKSYPIPLSFASALSFSTPWKAKSSPPPSQQQDRADVQMEDGVMSPHPLIDDKQSVADLMNLYLATDNERRRLHPLDVYTTVPGASTPVHAFAGGSARSSRSGSVAQPHSPLFIHSVPIDQIDSVQSANSARIRHEDTITHDPLSGASSGHSDTEDLP